jgi:hypothetical protein
MDSGKENGNGIMETGDPGVFSRSGGHPQARKKTSSGIFPPNRNKSRKNGKKGLDFCFAHDIV